MALGGIASGRQGRRSRRQTFSEINITPLTDVVLVLLIIFMVTAQFIEQSEHGMNLNLPSATEVDDLDSLGGLRVSIGQDGALALNGAPVLPEDLEPQLAAAGRSPEQLVIVEGDRETVLQHVVTVMDAAAGAGLPNVVLATAAEASTVDAPPDPVTGATAVPSAAEHAAEPLAADAPFLSPLPPP